MRYIIAALAIAFGLGIAQAGDGTPPEVPLTPIRLVYPTPLTSVILPPASEPYGVYLMVIKADATRTPTPKPLPTATRTASPTPRATYAPLPTVAPRQAPTPIATTALGRVCNSSSPDWRGANPAYPFCVARDMGWAGQGASVQYRFAGSGDWLTVAWDFYGVEWRELRLENNTGIAGCETRNTGTGAGGFRLRVPESGSYSFNVNQLQRGLYKLEMYVWVAGREAGHNEVFVCVR